MTAAHPTPLSAARNAAPALAATPEQAPLHAIAQALLPGDLVIDVGANSGDKAAALLGRGVRVVCVEPQPACVAQLEQRFKGHPAVSIVPKGLGERPGILSMHINSQSPVLSTFSPEWMTGRFAHETRDQKIDVEGFEYEVICGLSRRVGIVSFEFTDEFFGNAQRLMQYLQNLGYSRFNFSLGESPAFALGQWVAMPDLCAVLKDLFSKYRKVWGDIYVN